MKIIAHGFIRGYTCNKDQNLRQDVYCAQIESEDWVTKMDIDAQNHPIAVLGEKIPKNISQARTVYVCNTAPRITEGIAVRESVGYG